MKQFFKMALAAMLGTFFSFILIFILLIGLAIGIIASSGDDKESTVSENSILKLSIDFPIAERTSKNPFEDFDFTTFESNNNPGLNDIIANIKKAAEDEHIKGIYLDVSNIQGGFSTLEEIRNALINFKSSKKFIIAYAEVYTQKAYYIASVADKVYLNPQGLLEFKGLSSEIMFLKGALDKLELEAQIIKVGTYKSAIEPLILDKMSDANREQVTSFVGSIYDHFLQQVAESRIIPKDTLHNIANQLLVRSAKDAVLYKLADDLKYFDEVLTELKEKTGKEDKESVNFITLKKFMHVPEKKKEEKRSKNRIAIIYAAGEIQSGEGDNNTIGSDRFAESIRKARLDENVKAIILRVNSPGGSALASDVIWREVNLAKQVKPVIACMGDVAASGGYYIACAADTIIAQPNTITGSIGVFGVLFNAQKTFKNKLGITFDGVKTGEFADLGTMTRPLTDAERMIIQQEVNRIYDDFIGRVAAGRKMSKARVDSIGQGRVWSGTEALKIGLVDMLGGIDDAIAIAAKMAKLPDYKLVSYPDMKDPFNELIKELSGDVQGYMMKKELGEQYNYYKDIQEVLGMKGIQARIPYQVNIN